MVCQACGAAVEPGGRFCPRCGAQIMAPPVQPQYAASPQNSPYPPYPPIAYVPRVQRHLQSLGMLWLVFAAYRVITGLMGMFFVRAFVYRRWGGGWPWSAGWGPSWMHLMPFIATVTVGMALFSVFVGYSLVTRRSWGRVLAIIAGVLVLFKVPFGTALGIYTLWVLAPAASAMEYDSIAEPS
jgi:hypothetical protein